MRGTIRFSGLSLLLAVVLAGSMGQTAPAPATSPATKPANNAIVPVSKLENDSYDWFQRHSQILEIQKKLDPEIVLMGDSITHFWGGEPQGRANGPKAFADTFGTHRVLNMGFGWDRTQNVLWRLEHCEMDDCHPKVVVLNIGTNNFTGSRNARANTPEEVAEAVGLICDKIHAKSPTTRIIVMGVFPRYAKPDAAGRAPIKAVNALLAQQLAGKPLITFLDIGAQLLEADGTISPQIMGDATHPTEKGYAIWGQALLDAGVLK